MGVPCGWELTGCGCGGCLDELDAASRDRATAGAAYILWAATGRHYGKCQITVQPCNPVLRPDLYQTYPVAYDHGRGALGWPMPDEGGVWRNRSDCSCCVGRCELWLEGPTSHPDILEVTVDGVVVEPESYQIHNAYLLVRIDGLCWPTCVNYSSQAPPAMEVVYLRGDPIPEAVTDAAATLACEIGKACRGAKCRLPRRLASLSRQGVDLSTVTINTYLDNMLTGLTEVDAIIVASNPRRLAQRPQILSPDLHFPRHVSGSSS